MNEMLQHLKDRHLDINRYEGLYINEEQKLCTFLLYNLSGQIVGFQQYRKDAPKTMRNDP